MKFRGCDSINSKENIQVGYRNGSRIVNCECIDKTSLNNGTDRKLLFIIAYEIIRLYLKEFNRKYLGRLQKQTHRNRLPTNSLEFENCTQQLLTLTTCLPACSWAQITRTPFNNTITARTLPAKCDDYQFQRLILQCPALGYGIAWYRKHVHHNRTIKVRLEMLSEEKVASCFARKTISWSSNESSRKHENIALKSTMTKQWNSLILQLG